MKTSLPDIRHLWPLSSSQAAAASRPRGVMADHDRHKYFGGTQSDNVKKKKGVSEANVFKLLISVWSFVSAISM